MHTPLSEISIRHSYLEIERFLRLEYRRSFVQLDFDEDDTLLISMDGTLPESVRKEIIDKIQLFNKDWSTRVIDDQDRLDQSDMTRRHRERDIKKKLSKIIPENMDFRGARLSWTALARAARFLGVDKRSVKLRILLQMPPDDIEKFIAGIRPELDVSKSVPIVVSTAGIFTKKANLVR